MTYSPNQTIYPNHIPGVWCPGTCGGAALSFTCPAYGSSADYVVWCTQCGWTSKR